MAGEQKSRLYLTHEVKIRVGHWNSVSTSNHFTKQKATAMIPWNLNSLQISMINTPRLLKLVVAGEIKKMHWVFIAKRPFLELVFRVWLEKILQGSATKSFPALYEAKTVTGTASQLWLHFPFDYHHSFYFQFQTSSLMYPFWFC